MPRFAPALPSEDEWEAQDASPVADDVERELDGEEGEEDDVESVEEMLQRRVVMRKELGFDDA